MMDKLHEAILEEMKNSDLSKGMINRFPYSLWSVSDLEVNIQIINFVGIEKFIESKLNDDELARWAWHPYVLNMYSDVPAPKKLFGKEYDEMFSKLF